MCQTHFMPLQWNKIEHTSIYTIYIHTYIFKYSFVCMCVWRKRKIIHLENQLKFKCQHLVIQAASPVCHQAQESFNGCTNRVPHSSLTRCTHRLRCLQWLPSLHPFSARSVRDAGDTGVAGSLVLRVFRAKLQQIHCTNRMISMNWMVLGGERKNEELKGTL